MALLCHLKTLKRNAFRDGGSQSGGYAALEHKGSRMHGAAQKSHFVLQFFKSNNVSHE